MRVLFEKFHSFRVLRIAFAVLFVCILAFGVLMGDALDGKTGFVGMQTSFTVNKMTNVLQEWGEEGISAYLNSMYADFIFPIAYAVALASGVALISTEKERAAFPNKLALTIFTLPFIAGFCDIMENGFHLVMLQNPQSLSPVLTFLAALAATIKFILMGITILAIAFYAYQRVQARRQVGE